MSRTVYLIGAFSTEFRKWPDQSYKDLTREAYFGALSDSGLDSAADLESAWFANSSMGARGQSSIRGQVCLAPLIREGLFPAGTPVINVENACASGGTAAHCAWKDILSGQCEMSLAIGVDKLWFPEIPKEKVLAGFTEGVDNFDFAGWIEDYRRLSGANGDFNPGLGRTVFVDTAAARARWHMGRYGTTREQIAAACAKSHWYGARNPRAQYQFEVPAARVLADRVVSDPLTRAMCATPGDGAAAVLFCSGEKLLTLPLGTQRRAVEVAASVLTGGGFQTMGTPALTEAAALKAYRVAGITPAEVQVAELHDSSSFCEIEYAERLGLCEAGQGGPWFASGAAGPGGVLPVNTSGGLVSKSHPIGATGLAMLHELALQLRAEAGCRQVPGARIGLQHNCGGAIGAGDAICAVTILRARVQ